MSAVVRAPGEGERHPTGPGSEVVVKAGGAETGGSLFLAETVVAGGSAGPPLHRHAALHDMFYVLDGKLTVHLGEETRELGPGGFACVPPGTAHTFSNPHPDPVRFLNFSTPSGVEDYMRDLVAAARSGPPTPAALAAVFARHDVELA